MIGRRHNQMCGCEVCEDVKKVINKPMKEYESKQRCKDCEQSFYTNLDEDRCPICMKTYIASMSKALFTKEKTEDKVNHPKHYNSHPSGIECIQVTRHMSFNLGNVVKYLWRTDHKNGLEDLKKAMWYLQDEIALREKEGK